MKKDYCNEKGSLITPCILFLRNKVLADIILTLAVPEASVSLNELLLYAPGVLNSPLYVFPADKLCFLHFGKVSRDSYDAS